MRKKLVAAIMAITMLGSFAGCGNSGAKTTTKGNDGGGSKGGNELTVWCWDPAFNIYAMKEAEKVYQKDHPDFKLNIVETPWKDVQTKLTTAGTSGDLASLPDITLMQDNAFQKNVITYPDMFADLSGSGIKFDDFAKAKLAYSTVNGKNYGVPFDNGTVIGCYRTDVLQEAGYTVKDLTDITWSRYIEIGKDVLKKTKKPLLSCQAGESDVIVMMLQSAGASLFDDKGEPNIENNETLKEVMNVYTELVKSGVMIEVNDWDQYVGTLTNSTVGGTVNGCWILASIQTAKDQSGKWAVTNMPKLDKAANGTNYSNNGGSSWAISSSCKNKQLAQDFLAKTFAGSTALYDTILPSSGALATYIPAAKGEAYSKPSEFFNNEAIFTKITDFASKTPSNNTGVYYYEARDAVAVAITNIVAGKDLQSELKNAQADVKFKMGK